MSAVLGMRGINLCSEVARGCASHVVQDRSGRHDYAAARLVDGIVRGKLLEGLLHQIDALRHREQLGNVGFREIDHALLR